MLLQDHPPGLSVEAAKRVTSVRKLVKRTQTEQPIDTTCTRTALRSDPEALQLLSPEDLLVRFSCFVRLTSEASQSTCCVIPSASGHVRVQMNSEL
jgi:hypothetical protein